VDEKVLVTGELIEAARTERGGWRREALLILGAGWPPQPGWKERALGRTITVEEAMTIAGGRPAARAGPGLYSDGGCVGPNPSPRGGTWAWCLVGPDGGREEEASGFVTPAEAGVETVTNNYAELLAAVLALESRPAGWSGVLHTDSQITLYRVERRPPDRKPARMAGIPDNLAARLEAVKARLGDYRLVLLGGHPTRAELAAGRRRDGLPCSPHNVYCDLLCSRAAREETGWGKLT
jgi:ribonuclease HI